MIMGKVYRGVGWFFRLSTIANTYESQVFQQTAKRSISGPSGRKPSINALGKRLSICQKDALPLAQPSAAAFTTAHPESLPKKLSENYQKFQMENGLPIYIKGGFMDKMLISITAFLIVIGLLDGFSTLFTMAFPKKNR